MFGSIYDGVEKLYMSFITKATLDPVFWANAAVGWHAFAVIISHTSASGVCKSPLKTCMIENRAKLLQALCGEFWTYFESIAITDEWQAHLGASVAIRMQGFNR